jgi:hydrogenase expression/formation protein HypC
MCLGALGVVEATWDEGGLPMALVNGEPVCLMYTPEARIGDHVLSNLGYSVEIIDSKRAAEAIALREGLGLASPGKENP